MKQWKWPLIIFLAFAIIGLSLFQFVNEYIQLTALFILINCIAALSLNLINGVTGQFSLGHAGFMAIGAYFSGYLSQHFMFLDGPLTLLNLFIFTVLSGLLAAVAGVIVGQPSLRLKGDYLAIVTLGFGEIIRVSLLNMDFLGGPRGMSGIPELGSFLTTFLYISAWVVFTYFALTRILYAPLGRKLLSVREDEIAAESMGVNTTSAKVKAFAISSFFAGVAGSLMAHVNQFISPSSFGFILSVSIVIMVVLGGLSSYIGSIVAAALLTILPEVLRPLQDYTGIDLRMVIYSLLLIIMMLVKPQGLFGDKNVKLPT